MINDNSPLCDCEGFTQCSQEEERLARDWTIDTGDCCDLDLEYQQTNEILSNTWNIIKQMEYIFFIRWAWDSWFEDVTKFIEWVTFHFSSFLFLVFHPALYCPYFVLCFHVGKILVRSWESAALVNPQSPSFVSPLLFSTHTDFSTLPPRRSNWTVSCSFWSSAGNSKLASVVASVGMRSKGESVVNPATCHHHQTSHY